MEVGCCKCNKLVRCMFGKLNCVCVLGFVCIVMICVDSNVSVELDVLRIIIFVGVWFKWVMIDLLLINFFGCVVSKCIKW